MRGAGGCERATRACCKPSDEVKGLLRAAVAQLGLSARAYDRLLRVSRTIADLEGIWLHSLSQIADLQPSSPGPFSRKREKGGR